MKAYERLLRYAAVLENPGHSPAMQPRFKFSIVDENNNPLDEDCYSADFISSDALGWNTYHYDTNTVLWKDWTAIGVDLAPLDGQRIYVKMTTYDCTGIWDWLTKAGEAAHSMLRPSGRPTISTSIPPRYTRQYRARPSAGDFTWHQAYTGTRTAIATRVITTSPRR